jgi:arylsulfatase A-like enzyme
MRIVTHERYMPRRPNILVILTDQLRYPPPYESDELAEYRRQHLPGVERLRRDGVSFRHHYPRPPRAHRAVRRCSPATIRRCTG